MIVVTLLRITSLSMILFMLVSWMLYGIFSPFVLYFGLMGGVAGIDQAAVRGIRISIEGRRGWASQYIPPMALLHTGVAIVFVSVAYGLVLASIIGVFLGSAGTVLTYNRCITSARFKGHARSSSPARS